MIPARKQLVIVAAPNWSGKTTLVRSGALSQWLEVPPTSINADDVARDIAGGNIPTDAQSLVAARRCDAWLDRCIADGQSVLVETVLSSQKLRPRVEAARGNGFTVILIFVTLRTPELNLGRVAQRVNLGGHPVPADKIVRRRLSAHVNFAWFARFADLVLVFDNTEQPTFAAGKIGGTWIAPDPHGLPEGLLNEVLSGTEIR